MELWQEITEKQKLLDKAIKELAQNGVIYGYEDIAKLRFERDTSQVKYNANLEYIQTIKLMIRILENQLNREYGNTK